MYVVKYPYRECETCQSIEDCPHPEVSLDSKHCVPVPPECCQRPMDIVLTKRKKKDDI